MEKTQRLFKAFFIVLISAGLVASCVSQNSRGSHSSSRHPSSQHTVSEADDDSKPHWIKKPHLKNHLTAVGSAPPSKIGGENAQYLGAMDNGVKKLNRSFQRHKKALKRLGLNNTRDKKALSRKIEKLLLHKVVVRAEWRHPGNGRLYLWLVVSENSL